MPIILCLDGHKSRWCVAAIEYLHDNNVWPFVLPSHTSTLTQPNDCGVNFNLHVSIATIANQLCNNVHKCDAAVLNVIFCNAWKKNISDKEAEFMRCGENHATRAWKFCGYSPFDKN